MPPLDVIVRDGAGRVVGGLAGRTSLVLFLDYLVVPDDLRGRGRGSRALAIAEEEAIRRGCVSALLFTMVFRRPVSTSSGASRAGRPATHASSEERAASTR